MRRIGIRELRQNASKYIRLVKAGETLEVTERDVPVALLTPLPTRPKSRLEEMIERGEIIPGNQDWANLPQPAPSPTGLTSELVLEELREERLP